MDEIDFGNQFTSQTSTREFTLENRGRRALTLTWTNITAQGRKMMQTNTAKDEDDGKKRPKTPEPIEEMFSVIPTKIIMEPMSSYNFVFSSFSNLPDPTALEILELQTVVTKSKSKPKSIKAVRHLKSMVNIMANNEDFALD